MLCMCGPHGCRDSPSPLASSIGSSFSPFAPTPHGLSQHGQGFPLCSPGPGPGPGSDAMAVDSARDARWASASSTMSAGGGGGGGGGPSSGGSLLAMAGPSSAAGAHLQALIAASASQDEAALAPRENSRWSPVEVGTGRSLALLPHGRWALRLHAAACCADRRAPLCLQGLRACCHAHGGGPHQSHPSRGNLLHALSLSLRWLRCG